MRANLIAFKSKFAVQFLNFMKKEEFIYWFKVNIGVPNEHGYFEKSFLDDDDIDRFYINENDITLDHQCDHPFKGKIRKRETMGFFEFTKRYAY